MTTTDTTALQERIARALAIEAGEQEDGSPVWGDPEDIAAAFEEEVETWERFAAVVLPLVAAEVQAAKAEAWDEGYEAGVLDTYRLGRDMDLTITPAPNPYRETGDRA